MIYAANQNLEAITAFAALLLQLWCKKYSSDFFVVLFFFQFLFSQCPPK